MTSDAQCTRDKDQNLETQLRPLREYAGHQSTDAVTEYATDLKHRTAWHRLLEAARLQQIDVIIIWRMDPAFRSVLHAAQTLEPLKHWGVGLKSQQEAWWDTTIPMGEMMYDIPIVYAQLEKSLDSERVKAGMDRAKRQGKAVGRQAITGHLWGYGKSLPRDETSHNCREDLLLYYTSLLHLMQKRIVVAARA